MTDIIYSLIYIIPLILLAASTLLSEITDITELQSPNAPLFFMLITAVILTVIINARNKIRVIISGGLLALILGALLVTEKELRTEWFSANEWLLPALILTVAVVVAGTAILCVHPLKPTVGIIITGLLISSYWTRIFSDKISVVNAVFLAITILYEEIRYHKRKDIQIRSFVVRTVPFLLAGMIALYYMPTREEPYDWAVAKRIINNIADDITSLLQRFGEDSIGSMEASLGFSEESEISGDIGGDAEEMMTVSFGPGAPDIIYLDGKYFEDFDGREWTESEKTYPYMMDTIEACCAVSSVDAALSHDFSKTVSITVTYSGQNTRYVFAPIKAFASDISVTDASVSVLDNELTFDKRRGNTTSYDVDYLLINQNLNTLSVLSEPGRIADRECWERECARLGLSKEGYSYDAFWEYRNSLYDNSLWPNTPDKNSLSDEVIAFLDNAVADAVTDYDKLTALADAFSDFEYTATPGNLPKSIDSPAEFLDYFLLESKKGYCNSFATAFVLLCRAEGIPARYVHGYCVTRSDGPETTVYTSMAHAYPEAYLDGIGWMVFEPTPGYSSRTAWDERGEYEAMNYSYAPDIYAHFQQDDTPETPEVVTVKTGIKWYMIVIPAALCLLVLISIILIERAINIRRFEKLDRNAQAHVICRRIMNILKHQGFVKSDCETIREFAERAYTERSVSLSAFADVFETILYSNDSLSDKKTAALNNEYTLLRDSLNGKDKLVFKLLSFIGSE